MNCTRIDKGIYLERRGKWYQLRFYERERSPSFKRVSLRTDNAPLSMERARKMARDYRLGVFDPWKEKVKELDAVGAIREYEKARRDEIRPSSLRTITSVARQFVSSLPSNTMLKEVRSEDIRGFVYRPHLAPATQAGIYRNLKVWLGWCVTSGFLKANPIANVARPRNRRGVPKYLTVAQLDLLLKTIESDFHLKSKYIRHGDPRWLKEVIELAACTGLRLNELRHLRWNDVQLPKTGNPGFIVVQSYEGYRTKADSNGVVPLIPRATRLLDRLSESRRTEDPHEFVLKNSEGQQIPYKWTSRRFKHYREIANLPDVPFHGLRHTFAVMCRLAGIDILDLRDMMRHKSVKMTEGYSQFSKEMLAEKVTKAFQELESEAGQNASILSHSLSIEDGRYAQVAHK